MMMLKERRRFSKDLEDLAGVFTFSVNCYFLFFVIFFYFFSLFCE